MAAATSSVPMTTRPYDDVGVDRSLSVASAATYYLGSMICLNASRHAVKATDTAGLLFDGIASAFNQGLGYLAVATTDTLGEKKVRVERPHTFGMKIAAAVLADVGSPVYALYDNEVALAAGVTNNILVGWIDEVVNSTYVNIRPAWRGQRGETTFDGADLEFDGATTANNLIVPDNLADALSVKINGGADLMVVTTTDGAEKITVSTDLVMSGAVDLTFTGTTGQPEIALTDNLADALSVKIPSGNDLMFFTTTNSAEAVTIPASLVVGSDATDRVTIKGIYMTPSNVAVAVPTIADAEVDEVAVNVASAFSMAPAVGDAVIAIPAEALPTDCVFMGARVTNTDEITVSFGAKEGGAGVTGANKNFKFLVIDLT